MTAYGEMGDDAMGKQGRRDSLAGVLAGEVGFVSCVLLCASLLILPLSLTSPSKDGSRNPPPPLSPFLVQLRTVSKMTFYGELGDDAMGKKGRRAGLAGVLAGGVPLSSASTSKAGSRNQPPPLSPFLVQLRTVSKMTAYGELGDGAMGKQGMRAGLAGVLVGGVPLSPTSPSKAGSRNHPPPLSPLLVQLCTVSEMIAYGELGDDAMSKLGR